MVSTSKQLEIIATRRRETSLIFDASQPHIYASGVLQKFSPWCASLWLATCSCHSPASKMLAHHIGVENFQIAPLGHSERVDRDVVVFSQFLDQIERITRHSDEVGARRDVVPDL